MPRAKKRCADPTCRQYAPCPIHRTWKPSSGTRPLPGNWKSLKKKAEGYSEKRCYRCNRIDPTGQVDHKKNRAQGGSDAPENLGWMCTKCHALKTEQEKQEGRKMKRDYSWG